MRTRRPEAGRGGGTKSFAVYGEEETPSSVSPSRGGDEQQAESNNSESMHKAVNRAVAAKVRRRIDSTRTPDFKGPWSSRALVLRTVALRVLRGRTYGVQARCTRTSREVAVEAVPKSHAKDAKPRREVSGLLSGGDSFNDFSELLGQPEIQKIVKARGAILVRSGTL